MLPPRRPHRSVAERTGQKLTRAKGAFACPAQWDDAGAQREIAAASLKRVRRRFGHLPRAAEDVACLAGSETNERMKASSPSAFDAT